MIILFLTTVVVIQFFQNAYLANELTKKDDEIDKLRTRQ